MRLPTFWTQARAIKTRPGLCPAGFKVVLSSAWQPFHAKMMGKRRTVGATKRAAPLRSQPRRPWQAGAELEASIPKSGDGRDPLIDHRWAAFTREVRPLHPHDVLLGEGLITPPSVSLAYLSVRFW